MVGGLGDGGKGLLLRAVREDRLDELDGAVDLAAADAGVDQQVQQEIFFDGWLAGISTTTVDTLFWGHFLHLVDQLLLMLVRLTRVCVKGGCRVQQRVAVDRAQRDRKIHWLLLQVSTALALVLCCWRDTTVSHR